MSTSPACSQALGLPEIVAAILEQLGDPKALFAAVQVNKLWADEATTILWRDASGIQNIIWDNDIARVQYYADRIVRLPEYYQLLRYSDLWNLRYPRLSVLSTWIIDEGDEQAFLHYLQPGLRRISYHCQTPISDSVLMQIGARCPTLRALVIGSQEKTVKCDLLRLLRVMPSLTDLCLDRDLENVELCIHLASRPNLQKLSVPNDSLLPNATTWTEDHTTKILANVTKPFPQLECISWFLEGRASHSLVPHLFGLKDLKLTLADASDDVLFAISSCINLATADVWFQDDSRVSGEGLLAVARKCPHLHTLILHGLGDSVDGRTITDDIIRQVATYLPAMTRLQIGDISTDLTITALLSLGDLCTKLEACSLRGNFDLEQLWRPNLAPLFTQLKSLELSSVPKNISLDRAISILDQQAPQVILKHGAWYTYLEAEAYTLD